MMCDLRFSVLFLTSTWIHGEFMTVFVGVASFEFSRHFTSVGDHWPYFWWKNAFLGFHPVWLCVKEISTCNFGHATYFSLTSYKNSVFCLLFWFCNFLFFVVAWVTISNIILIDTVQLWFLLLVSSTFTGRIKVV